MSCPVATVVSGKSTTSVNNIFDVVVIGGGLSGLVVANGLIDHGRLNNNWKLMEASDRLGGRLINAKSNTIPIDMGGAWIWPDHQPHMLDLVTKFNIPIFKQPDDPSSTRIDGGAVRFIEELDNQIRKYDNEHNSMTVVESDHCSIMLNTPITSCTLLNDHDFSLDNNDKSLVQLKTNNGEFFLSRKVVFAVPPKIISKCITFHPPLTEAKTVAMAQSRTWMAGVTKVALVYPNKFWSTEMSNSGLPSSSSTNGGRPAFQVYDSSTKDGSITALTFFAHVPNNDIAAQSDDTLLAKQVAEQMGLLWTYYNKPEYVKKVHSYNSFHIYRWPMNRYISGQETKPKQIHPHPIPNRALSTPEWDNRLLFAGTETDLISPGVMQGAVSAAKRVLTSLFQ